jgi:hypothetical protein
MPITDNLEKEADNWALTPSMYDVYLPAVYGKILGIVHKEPIANKILEKVFMDIYATKKAQDYKLQPPLITLLNHAREKSYQTIKALTMFRECCSGASVHMTGKE